MPATSPTKQGDGVLVLRARGRHRGRRRLGGVQGDLGLGDVLLGVDPGARKHVREAERLLVVVDGVRVELEERVLLAELEVELRQAGLLAQGLVRPGWRR